MKPFVHPSLQVPDNKLGIEDMQTLLLVQGEIARINLMQMMHTPLQGNYDVPHLSLIHKFLFSDLYDWAGQLRTWNIEQPGHAPGWICKTASVTEMPLVELEMTRYLQDHKNLRGLKKAQFISRLAYYYSRLYFLYPFAQGNQIAIQAMINLLCHQAGYAWDYSKIAPDQFKLELLRSIPQYSKLSPSFIRPGDIQRLISLMEIAISPILQEKNTKKSLQET